MAARVDYTKLLSEAWQNVYDLINNKSNVADPTTTSAEYRKWIYSRDPDVKASDFAGYPFIIVNPAMMDTESAAGSVDRKSKSILWTVEVEVVSSDRGANNQEGKGLTNNDAIADDVLQTFSDSTNKTTLRANNMLMSMPSATGIVIDDFHNERVYRRSIILSFRTKMQVSA